MLSHAICLDTGKRSVARNVFENLVFENVIKHAMINGWEQSYLHRILNALDWVFCGWEQRKNHEIFVILHAMINIWEQRGNHEVFVR